jgi:hypothetical protein
MKKEINIDENLTKQLLTDDKALNGFVLELQKFLKTKLDPCENDKGVIDYWTCGMDHFYLPPNYEPHKNVMKFCAKKHLDYNVIINRIEQYVKLSICCECFLVNQIDLKEA